MPSSARPSVAVLSLESWDQMWRRNQYLASALVRQGLVDRVLFVDPPTLQMPKWEMSEPVAGVTVISPSLPAPKRVGGLRMLGRALAYGPLRTVDVLWINDPTLGVEALRRGQPAIYDVTDDWRWADEKYRIWRRLVRAEDLLARRARTVVCSEVLRHRWQLRYDVDPAVVPNGIDATSWQAAEPRPVSGDGPHIGYVGTLHQARLDIDLILRLAAHPAVGTLHLVGPNAMAPEPLRRLRSQRKIRLDGPVPAPQVPSTTCSFDVLISPHVISPFTLSLDAIKSHEYLASGRPIVATPTSGFQELRSSRLTLASGDDFIDAVVARLGEPRRAVADVPGSWDERARDFAAVLGSGA